MNAASIKTSHRLQRVRDALADHKEHSTRSLVINANVCAVNSCVAELRAQGYDIECQRRGGRWFYRMVKGEVA